MADERVTEFRGTPIECEAWLRRFFDSIRIFLGDEDDVLETFERTVWSLKLVAVDGMLRDRTRPNLRPYVDTIDLERELFSLLTKAGEDEDNVDSATMLTDQETVDLED